MTSSLTHGGRRTAPYAFTEQGVAMLSSVLNSPRAIAVNIEIMRTFVRVRALAATHGDLAKRLGELEEKTEALALQQDIQPKHPCAIETGLRGHPSTDDAARTSKTAHRVCDTAAGEEKQQP